MARHDGRPQQIPCGTDRKKDKDCGCGCARDGGCWGDERDFGGWGRCRDLPGVACRWVKGGTPRVKVLGHRAFAYAADVRAAVLAAMDARRTSRLRSWRG